MKTAAMILGIIGGAIDAIFGLIVIAGGAMIGQFAGNMEGMSQLASGRSPGSSRALAVSRRRGAPRAPASRLLSVFLGGLRPLRRNMTRRGKE